MAKKESSFLKLVLSLTLITFIAAAALAAVFTVTKEPIAKSIIEKKNKAIQLVLPGFDANKGSIEIQKVLLNGESDSITVYVAKMNNKLFGMAIETYTKKAFSGRFDIMVGFDDKGTILGTEVLKAKETPGLGDKIDKKKSDFAIQFKGKSLPGFNLKVKKDGGDVDAITAATISSRAYCNAIDNAFKTYQVIIPQFNTPTDLDSTQTTTK
jgi:Na+-translocating ferredoxin:NAD+ oxidoreductase subunit G